MMGNSTSPDSSLSFAAPLLVTLFSNVLVIRSSYRWFDPDHNAAAASESKVYRQRNMGTTPAIATIYGDLRALRASSEWTRCGDFMVHRQLVLRAIVARAAAVLMVPQHSFFES
jgi:hypothetical protein